MNTKNLIETTSTRYHNLIDMIDPIIHNPNLSDEGRQVQLDRVTELKQAEFSGFVSSLKSIFENISKDYHQENAAINSAVDAINKEFDYARLRYEGEAAITAVRQSINLHEVEKAHQAAVDGHDGHKIKAWAEAVPAVVRSLFGAAEPAEANNLANKIKTSYLLSSPDLTKAKTQAEANVQAAYDATALQQQLIGYYDNGGYNAYMQGIELRNTSQGVKVTRQWDADGGSGIVTSLQVESA